MAGHNGINIRSRIRHDKLLKSLYKKSARHWFWQILRWKFTKKNHMTDCSFCKNVDGNCDLCLIDKSLCDRCGLKGMVADICAYGRKRIKLARKLRKELKKRAK